MKRINSFIGIAAALILATALAWSQAAAADSSLVRTTFPSPENPGPPVYARTSDSPPYFFTDGAWAAIYFYRNPSCVPPEFNLLLFFDFTGSFACSLEVHGFDLWEVEPFSGAPKTEISIGNGAVPVWFAPVDVLDQAIQDGKLTISELAGLDGLLVGYADRFNEAHHPSGPLPPELGGGGQLAAGSHIQQISTKTTTNVTKAEIEELHQLLVELRAKVEAEAQPDKKEAALERVDELEQAIAEKKPDLTTMEYVKNWFVKHLPGLAGTVTSVVLHPIVGKLVEAGGDALVGEFQRRFGGTPP